MANQRGQGLGITPFDPVEGVQATNVPGSTGGAADQAGNALFGVSSVLGQKVGALGDQLAALEGKRAGEAAGADPNFRPSNGWTIRQQAWDKAGVETYLNNLDARISSDMTGAYLKWRERPDASPSDLVATFAKIKQDYTSQHVFPEIQGQFERRFTHLELGFVTHATDRYDQWVRGNERASIIEATDAHDKTKQTLLAGDPENPATIAAVNDQQRASEAKIRAGIASGAIKPDAGEKMILDSQADTLTQLWSAKIANTPPEKLAEGLDEFRRKRRAGEVALDLPTALKVEATYLKAIKDRDRAAVAEANGLQQQSKNMIERALDGNPPSMDERRQLLAAAGNAPLGADIGTSTLQHLDWIDIGRKLGPNALARVEQELIAQGGATPDAKTASDIKFVRDIRTKLSEKMKTDPVGFATAQRLAPIQTLPVDGDAASLGNALQDRVAQMKGAQATEGLPGRYLTPDEARILQTRVAKGGDDALAVAGAIVAGAGADAPAVIGQISKDVPEFARLGALVAGGRPQQVETAKRIADYLKAKAVRGPGEKEVVETPLPQQHQTWRAEVFGRSYIDDMAKEAEITTAAEAIYKAEAFRQGITDPKADETKANETKAKKLWQESLQRAAGRTTIDGRDYGGYADFKGESWWTGRAKVRVPDNVAADALPKLIGSITDKDLGHLGDKAPMTADGRPFSAADIKNAYPIAAPGGYHFSTTPPGQTPRWITTRDGLPWRMRWADFEPQFRQRVPSAFLGGAP